MKNKQVAFAMPYIGYDYGQEFNLPFDAVIGQFGNPIIGFKLKNSVEQYSADPNAYLHFHSVLNQIVAIVGEEHIIQKIDIFTKQIYKAEPSNQFLQQKYSEHFDGRPYKVIESLLFISDLVDTRKKKAKYEFTEKKYKELRDKAQKVFLLLNTNGFSPIYMKESDYEFYLLRQMAMQFSDVPALDNISASDLHLRIGKNWVRGISFVDVEDIQLPSEIETFSYLGGSGAAANTAVDNFSFLNELEDYQTIVYNQIISIPNQAQQQRELDKKKRKLEGVAKNNPSNAINAMEIETLLHNIAVDGQLIVDAHFSLVYSADTFEQLEKLHSIIDSKLFQKGIVTSKRAFNQMELYRCSLPGNAAELRPYDLFQTTSEAAISFFFKESYPVNEPSPFYLRFTDRQGVPLKIDPCDLPMKTGRINNRNKFVLGPSGSGKSFLMNNIVEQYLTYNYDVVIVDTGDSYSGTCKYKGGTYIQYTEENPITMNPFKMAKEEFNIEKIEFLTNLIFLIWKGADATMNNTEKSILDNTMMSFYQQYFNADTEWYASKTDEELLHYLDKFNIHAEDIDNDINFLMNEDSTYYDILGLPFDSTSEDIRKKGRKLITEHHPDTNQNNKDYNPEFYFRIIEAYQTLSDEQKRAEYNETTLMLISPNEVIKKFRFSVEEKSESFRNALIKRIKTLQKTLEVKELSFNGFYDYASKFLPIYLNNRNHPVTTEEFNLSNFRFVLKDFYKGGRYETTLNQSADNTLFEEPFIVFEIDNVKDNPKLFPIVTLIIMDTFIQKMRLRKDRRKALIIEEAWKAIASKLMGGYILYLYKTVRKFWGEAVVVTQELDDIIGNAVVKDSIINNSDTFILLDQTKFKDNFDKIASLLSLNKIEQNKIFTINNLNNKYGRARFKEFYLKRGAKGEVYGNEVSVEQYLTYTTEKPEKSAIEYYVNNTNGNFDNALSKFVLDSKKLDSNIDTLIQLTNLNKNPLTEQVIEFYKNYKKNHPNSSNIFKEIQIELEYRQLTFAELLKNYGYAS